MHSHDVLMSYTRRETSDVRVEVVFAAPDRQELIEIEVPSGTSVDEAIAASSIDQLFPGIELAHCDVGIWGRIVERNTLVSDGDRVEIYRPLLMDPRDSRRLRARGPD